VTFHLRGAIGGTTVDTVLAIADMQTGDSREVTIPSTAVQGGFVHVDFADLTIPAGHRLGILPIDVQRSFADVVFTTEI
jgi:hypothetical protein